MPPHVDLVIVFKTNKITLSKQQAREDAAKAEEQYSKLLSTLKQAGLLAVGKRGQKDGELVILVSSPPKTLANLVHRERHTDFLSGLPTASIPSATKSFEDGPPSPAERIRLLHSFITSLPQDGGLGIAPQSDEWPYVDSIMPLHDKEFNSAWLKAWSISQFSSVSVDAVRAHLGDSVALYFTFLSTYFKALIFPSALGIVFWYLGAPYSPLYSHLLVLWSITFVEYWRIRERVLALRWGTSGSLKVERFRPHYEPGLPWWKREFRVLASVPVTLLFTGILAALMTGIFLLEAFVSMLYTGPAHMVLQTLSPAILFTLLVPRVLRSHLARAKSYTAWENHAHESSYEASLSTKTFALASVVSYFNLVLSALVYVPFGDNLTGWVQTQIFTTGGLVARDVPVTVESFVGEKGEEEVKAALGVWNLTDVEKARSRLNPKRLQEQMFAFMVTNQIVNAIGEVIVPYIVRQVKAYRARKAEKAADGADGKKKKVAFEDEVKEKDIRGATESDVETKQDREFLEGVRSESRMPVYDLFGDYNETVTQFGYVAMWSAIWPLAGVAALINNFFELRSDAFKVTHITRRPIPQRTDTIGPWLNSLTFITWFAAVSNSALVYLYNGSSVDGATTHLLVSSAHPDGAEHGLVTSSTLDTAIKRQLLFKAALIALGASHGFIIVRAVIRHLLELALWKGSPERLEAEKNTKEVKEKYLESVEAKVSVEGVANGEVAPIEEESSKVFWSHDEGLDQIRQGAKDA